MARLLLLLVAALIVLASAQPANRFPGRAWERGRPNNHGFDEAKLKDALTYPFTTPLSMTYCVSVHKGGILIADRYADGIGEKDPSIIWSVSKAVMITVIGILEKNQRLSRSDKITKYIPEWVGVPGAEDITLDHVLRMDSGRYYDVISDFVVPQFLNSQMHYSLHNITQQHAPGAVDQYNQMAFLTLARVFARVVPNESLTTWFQRNLAAPLNFEARNWWQEESFFLNVPQDGPLVYGGLHTTCHDLARFGHLWLHKGKWQNREIFSEAFYAEGLQRAPAPRAGRQYHWGGGPTHRAAGMGGQLVAFNPELDLVITRIGDPFGMGWNAGSFVNKVIESLTGPKGSWDPQAELDYAFPEEERRLGEAMYWAGGLEQWKLLLEEQPEQAARLLLEQQ